MWMPSHWEITTRKSLNRLTPESKWVYSVASIPLAVICYSRNRWASFQCTTFVFRLGSLGVTYRYGSSGKTTDPADPAMQEGCGSRGLKLWCLFFRTAQTRNLISPNAVSGAPKCYKICFRPGLRSGSVGGAHSVPPDLLAALRNPTSKGRERRRKKTKNGMGQQVKVRASNGQITNQIASPNHKSFAKVI